ncbi:F-box/LRR-repeat protein [Carex littledalei]|uniref:F-box/LRR-repeat protein n=1 Tax=Carex littledalei TaxID=544730 RepID=A0A833QI02_9POAL|nr:F-box/LRR-repeat protein [Carex littledalei]
MDSPTDPNPTTGLSTSASTSTSSRVSSGWNELNHELILSILPRISALDLIAGANSVCSSWRAAARDPICWRILDLSDWDAVTTRFGAHISFTQVLQRILAFSRDWARIEKLYFPPSADGQDLIFVADRLPNLKYLSLPNPEIQEDEFFIALPKFESLTGLAIDQYFGQSVNILSFLQKNCPYLTEFKLFGQEDRLEHHHAMIICYFLPNLRKLEIPIRLSRQAILVFLEELHGLEYLDISGYQDSVINNEILEKASRLKVFIWHSGRELGEFVVCSNCGGDESVTMPCQCALGQKMMEWLADP